MSSLYGNNACFEFYYEPVDYQPGDTHRSSDTAGQNAPSDGNLSDDNAYHDSDPSAGVNHSNPTATMGNLSLSRSFTSTDAVFDFDGKGDEHDASAHGSYADGDHRAFVERDGRPFYVLDILTDDCADRFPTEYAMTGLPGGRPPSQRTHRSIFRHHLGDREMTNWLQNLHKSNSSMKGDNDVDQVSAVWSAREEPEDANSHIRPAFPELTHKLSPESAIAAKKFTCEKPSDIVNVGPLVPTELQKKYDESREKNIAIVVAYCKVARAEAIKALEKNHHDVDQAIKALYKKPSRQYDLSDQLAMQYHASSTSQYKYAYNDPQTTGQSMSTKMATDEEVSEQIAAAQFQHSQSYRFMCFEPGCRASPLGWATIMEYDRHYDQVHDKTHKTDSSGHYGYGMEPENNMVTTSAEDVFSEVPHPFGPAYRINCMQLQQEIDVAYARTLHDAEARMHSHAAYGPDVMESYRKGMYKRMNTPKKQSEKSELQANFVADKRQYAQYNIPTVDPKTGMFPILSAFGLGAKVSSAVFLGAPEADAITNTMMNYRVETFSGRALTRNPRKVLSYENAAVNANTMTTNDVEMSLSSTFLTNPHDVSSHEDTAINANPNAGHSKPSHSFGAPFKNTFGAKTHTAFTHPSFETVKTTSKSLDHAFVFPGKQALGELPDLKKGGGGGLKDKGLSGHKRSMAVSAPGGSSTMKTKNAINDHGTADGDAVAGDWEMVDADWELLSKQEDNYSE
ncbi:hypothetical protein LTR66_012523 [Elasticomyces elasticus]|nr:hypothetical protein LTR66_012523 [Elasticomyces elasticus]